MSNHQGLEHNLCIDLKLSNISHFPEEWQWFTCCVSLTSPWQRATPHRSRKCCGRTCWPSASCWGSCTWWSCTGDTPDPSWRPSVHWSWLDEIISLQQSSRSIISTIQFSNNIVTSATELLATTHSFCVFLLLKIIQSFYHQEMLNPRPWMRRRDRLRSYVSRSHVSRRRT